MYPKTIVLFALVAWIACLSTPSLNCIAQDRSAQSLTELQKKLEGAIILRRGLAGAFIGKDLIALPYRAVHDEIETMKRRRTSVTLYRDQAKSEIECRIIAYSKQLGIAILRSLESVDVDPVELADSKLIRPGDKMHVFQTSNPANKAGKKASPFWVDSVTRGTIRSATGDYMGFNSVASFSEQSEGIVFDSKGALVGLPLRAQSSWDGTCDAIRRSLEGSIVDAKIEWDEKGSKGSIKLNAIDAFRNLQEVRMAIWPESPWKVDDRSATQERMRDTVLLELDEEEGTWKTTIQAKDFPSNKLLWGMALLKSKEGDRKQGPFLLKVPPEMVIENPYRGIESIDLRPRSVKKPYSEDLKKSLASRFQSGEKDVPDTNPIPPTRKIGVSEVPPAKVQPRIIQFEKANPISIVSHPSGSHIYVLLAGDPFVYVYNTVDFSFDRKLPVPLYPSAAWCGHKELAVASIQSKVITYYDLETYKTRTLQLNGSGDSGYHPISFSGLAPDGSLMSVWDSGGDRKLFLLSPDQKPLYAGISKGGSRYVLPKACDYLLVQKEDVSPSGVPEFVDIADGKTESITFSKRFNKTGIGKHDDTGKILLSADGDNIFIPQIVKLDRKLGLELGIDDQYRFRTYVLTVDFQTKVETLPGYVIQEVPQQDLLISWATIPSKEPNSRGERDTQEVLFIHRYSGKVTRRIELDEYHFRQNPNALSKLIPVMAYVPGRDVIVIADAPPLAGRICIYECGSEPSDTAHRVTSSESAAKVRIPRLRSKPPTQLHVGKEFHFVPELQEAHDAHAKFLLTKGLPGMKIDEKSGRLDFKAQPFHVGEYEMRIDLEIEGQRYLLAEWILKVQK